MKRTKCPYIPTCSQYGLEAIQKYGSGKGTFLAETYLSGAIFIKKSKKNYAAAL